jgi:hypothetical protein
MVVQDAHGAAEQDMAERLLGIVVASVGGQQVEKIERERRKPRLAVPDLPRHIHVPPRRIGGGEVEKQVELIAAGTCASRLIGWMHCYGGVGKIWIWRDPLGQQVSQRGCHGCDGEGIAHSRRFPRRLR